jgi:hypothetical protein
MNKLRNISMAKGILMFRTEPEKDRTSRKIMARKMSFQAAGGGIPP